MEKEEMKSMFRGWSKTEKIMSDVKKIDFCNGEIDARSFEETEIEEVVLMVTTDINDKNGKEIFEFDVVSLPKIGDLKPLVGVVKRMEGKWVVDTGKASMDLWSEIEETEILGNMFENPDLIPY